MEADEDTDGAAPVTDNVEQILGPDLAGLGAETRPPVDLTDTLAFMQSRKVLTPPQSFA